MEPKPVNPTSNFIPPASIFKLVQQLQRENNRPAPQASSSRLVKTEAPPTGDPQDFQALLNTVSKRTDRPLAE
jgi:hypothetical protein